LATWHSFIANDCWQFGNSALLNICWRFGIHVLLNICWQFGIILLLNSNDRVVAFIGLEGVN
jgi:hypothetical protein